MAIASMGSPRSPTADSARGSPSAVKNKLMTNSSDGKVIGSDSNTVLRFFVVFLAFVLLFTVPLVIVAQSDASLACINSNADCVNPWIHRIEIMKTNIPKSLDFSWRTVRQHIIVEHSIVALVFGGIPVAIHVSSPMRPKLGEDKYWYHDRPRALLFAASTVVIGMLECVSHVLHMTVTPVHWWWAPLKIGYLSTGLLTLCWPDVISSIRRRHSSIDMLNIVTFIIYPFVTGQLYNAELVQGKIGSPTSFLETGIVSDLNPFEFLYDFVGSIIDTYDLGTTVLCETKSSGIEYCNPFSPIGCVFVSLFTFALCMIPALFCRSYPFIVSTCFAVHMILQGMYGFFASDHFMSKKQTIWAFFAGLDILMPRATHLCWIAHRSIQITLIIVILRSLVTFVFQCIPSMAHIHEHIISVGQFISFHVAVTVSLMAFGMSSFVPESPNKVHLFILLHVISIQAAWTAKLLLGTSKWKLPTWGQLTWKHIVGYMMFFFGTHNFLKLWLWHYQEIHGFSDKGMTYPWFNMGIHTVSPRFPFRFWHVVCHCLLCFLFAACYWGFLDPKNLCS